MYDSVRDALFDFNAPLEGVVHWPYQDILGLVTVGIGCLIEPVGLALTVPWLGHPDAGVIRAEWAKVNAMAKGMHFAQYEHASSLRLNDNGVEMLLAARAADFEVTLRKYFANWDTLPADAQLAIMGMAWACGAGFPRTFTNFTRAINARNFTVAAQCAKIREDGNPGIHPRNLAVQLCLANAAAIDTGEDYGTPALYWPGVASDAPQEHHDLASEAADALARFSIDSCGITGHCHKLEAA